MQNPKYPDIDIQLTKGDTGIIEKYVKELIPPYCYLEIGTAEGGSAITAYEAARKDIEIYAIDPRDVFKGPRDKIRFFQETSHYMQRAWNLPIGVLFIDGDHDSAGADFMYWNRFVIRGGMILFHDYKNGSSKVDEDCDYLFKDNPKFIILNYCPEGEKTSIFQVIKL